MYNCQICGSTSTPRQPMRKHIITRLVPADRRVVGVKIEDRFIPLQDEQPMREEIAREIKVCVDCHEMINSSRKEQQEQVLRLMIKSKGQVQKLSQRMQIKLKVKKENV